MTQLVQTLIGACLIKQVNEIHRGCPLAFRRFTRSSCLPGGLARRLPAHSVNFASFADAQRILKQATAKTQHFASRMALLFVCELIGAIFMAQALIQWLYIPSSRGRLRHSAT